MPIALVTNYLPPYRVPLYRLLHERYGVEVHCFGGEAHYIPDSLRTFVSIDDFSSLLNRSGFHPIDVRSHILGGIGLHWAAK